MTGVQLEMPRWRPAPDFYIETKAHALSYFMGAALIQVTALDTGEITALIKVDDPSNNGDLKVITGVLQFYRDMDGESKEAARRPSKMKPQRPAEGEAAP